MTLCQDKKANSLTNLDKVTIINLLYHYRQSTKTNSRAFAPIVKLVNALYGIEDSNDAFMYHDLMRYPTKANLQDALLKYDFPFDASAEASAVSEEEKEFTEECKEEDFISNPVADLSEDFTSEDRAIRDAGVNKSLEERLWMIYTYTDVENKQAALIRFFKENPEFKVGYVRQRDGAEEFTSVILRELSRDLFVDRKGFLTSFQNAINEAANNAVIDDYQWLLVEGPVDKETAQKAPNTVYFYLKNRGENNKVLRCQNKALIVELNEEPNALASFGRIGASLRDGPFNYELTLEEKKAISQQFKLDKAVKEIPPLTWSIVRQACDEYKGEKHEQKNPFKREAALMKILAALCDNKGDNLLSNSEKIAIIGLLYEHRKATKRTSSAFDPIVTLVNALYGITGQKDAFMYIDLMAYPNKAALRAKLEKYDFPIIANANGVNAPLEKDCSYEVEEAEDEAASLHQEDGSAAFAPEERNAYFRSPLPVAPRVETGVVIGEVKEAQEDAIEQLTQELKYDEPDEAPAPVVDLKMPVSVSNIIVDSIAPVTPSMMSEALSSTQSVFSAPRAIFGPGSHAFVPKDFKVYSS